MKTLTLFRHAKSDWTDRSMRDFDRPINARGIKGADLMGRFAARQKVVFDHVVASPAVRVTETIDRFEQGYGQSLNPDWDRRVYLASSATLIDVLKSAGGNANHVLMIGHNPGLEDLILDLVPDDGSNPLRDTVEEKFPTAAMATIELAIDSWDQLTEGCGTLKAFTRPRDLDPSLGPQDY